jgi:hypothetical protein
VLCCAGRSRDLPGGTHPARLLGPVQSTRRLMYQLVTYRMVR